MLHRALLFPVLALVSTLPCLAAHKINVAAFEQALTHCKPSDTDCAAQISDYELTEQLTQTHVDKIAATLPGPVSRQRLQAVASLSTFLDLPATEIPPSPPPSLDEQRHIMGQVITYVNNAIPKLPNFYATREIARYEDTPLLQLDQGFREYQPLHYVGASSLTILYRNGLEKVDTGKEVKASADAVTSGLNTWGTFGPVLGIVLLDAAKNKLAWSHWESGPGHPVAVFNYSVPQAGSHYEVDYCCMVEQTGAFASLVPFRQYTGYHGEIAVDQATGTILRLTLIAELKPLDPINEASMVVEYGTVEIGGQNYICPTRTVSYSHSQEVRYGTVSSGQRGGRGGAVGAAAVVPDAYSHAPYQTRLNDTHFIDYHVFRAESRILATDESAPAPPEDATPQPARQSETAFAQPPASALQQPAPVEQSAQSAPPAAPAEAPEQPEIVLGNGMEEPATPTAAASPSSFTLRTVTRLVEVPIVAFDKKGHPVTDLKADDLILLDNGHRQTIHSFSQAAGEAPVAAPAAPATAPTDEPVTVSNRESTPATHTVRGATILLIDSANVAFSDLSWAREQMQTFLKSLGPSDPVGLYVLRSVGFEILIEPTEDHAAVSAKLARWMPTAQDLAHAQEQERTNHQQIDEVHKVTDLEHVNGHTSFDDSDGGTDALDPQLRDYGKAPGQDALATLVPIARHLAAIPGRKSLVWVASDNVLADWSGRSAPVDKNSNTLATATMRAQEALNEARVSLYPLDASQLEVGGVGAEMQHRNVELTPTARDMASLAGAATGGSSAGSVSSRSGEDISTGRNMQPGRITAQMQQDLHAIAPEYQDLAASTGGRALRRAGDIAAELNGIVDDGRAAYLLSFTPDTPADGQYHRITVQWADKRKGSLRYRAGYVYRKEPESIRDRLRDAIWEPGDLREIGVSVAPAQSASGPTLKLTLAASDLALVEQSGHWIDRVDLILVTRDDTALLAHINGKTLALRLKPASYQTALRDGIQAELPLPKMPASATVRLIVVDQASNRIGSITLPAAALTSASVSSAQHE